MNALRHAAILYDGIAATGSGLNIIARRIGAERSILADEIDKEIDAPGEVTEAELDDVRRRAESGDAAVATLISRTEQQLADLIEDLPDDAIKPALRDTILASIAVAKRMLLDHMLTLRASADRIDPISKGAAMGWLERKTDVRPLPAIKIFRLWYGTNRSPVYNAGKLSSFGSGRGSQIHYGHCDVAIPRTHEIGSLGSPWWHRILRGDDRLTIKDIAELQAAAFWQSARARLAAGSSPGDAVVFLHGYNCSFADAALRAAQIGADLALGGLMAFFSWPSRGRILGYVPDEAAIEASEGDIVNFLTDFATKSDARAVHVIAHSMGNRGLLRAVQRIASSASAQSGVRFNQIILAAPDVDSGTFRQLAGAYAQIAERTTLYVSRADLAVRASRLLHGADRIGFAPPIEVIDGIETVNVTGVDLTLLGHGYVGECRPVLTDIHELLKRGTAPDGRTALRERFSADNKLFWEIIP